MDACTAHRIRIRHFAARDRSILRHLYLETRRRTFTWLETSTYNLTDFDADTRGERIWVADYNGEVAGFASAWLPESFLHALYVAAAFQGHGIGTALLNAVCAELDRPVRLKCMANNQRALAFYTAKGWSIAATESDKDGEYYLMKSG